MDLFQMYAAKFNSCSQHISRPQENPAINITETTSSQQIDNRSTAGIPRFSTSADVPIGVETRDNRTYHHDKCYNTGHTSLACSQQRSADATKVLNTLLRKNLLRN